MREVIHRTEGRAGRILLPKRERRSGRGSPTALEVPVAVDSSRRVLPSPPWYALRTLPRHEKASGRRLSDLGLPVVIPSYRRRRRWSDRIKTVDCLAFPGYIFCQFPRSDFPRIRSTPGVLYVVPSGVPPVEVPEWQIQSLRQALARDLHLEPVRRLQPGSLVEVREGPLRGIVGRLVRRGSQCRLVIAIDLLQQGIEAEVLQDSVAPLPDRAPETERGSRDVRALERIRPC